MEEFTYRGYPIKKLLQLCDVSKTDRGKAPVLFSLPEQYSQGRIFREYARFPEDLPLNIYADHGAMYITFDVYPHELYNRAYAYFAFHSKKYENFMQQSKKLCYKVPQPMIWYRREHNIEQLENARGTLFFAFHSTPDMLAVYDVKEICDMLKALPDEMQPVGVCLFMTDVHRGTHLQYMENGLPVYTAGNVWDIRFADRFYDIMRRFKYTASNYLGSYVAYSIEMGIPFSFISQEYNLVNMTDKNFSVGVMEKSLQRQNAEKLFSGLNKTITKQQQHFLDYHIDMKDYISREEMYEVLMKAYYAVKKE